MLCHIQKHTKIHTYSARDKIERLRLANQNCARMQKNDGTMDVGFRTLRMRVRVRCLHECTGRMLIRIWCILDVDSTVQQRLGGYGAESWIFYQTVTRPPWFSKSKLYGHTWNIYNFASYLWFKKSQYNREAVLNRSTSYPPCITAIETSHKQKEDVYNGTTNDFPSIHLPSAVGSLKVDNLHTTVFDISPRKYISQVFFSSVWQKQHQATKDFLLMDLMSRGSTVYRTDPPPLCSKSLLLRMQVNLGLRGTNKMVWPHKAIR